MGHDIIPMNGGGDMLARDARRSSRAMSRGSSRGAVRRSDVDNETDVTLSKTDSLTALAGAMMADITRVAQAQQQFELLAPQASARLNMVADAHALDLMEQAAEHRRALRRF